MHHNVHSHEHCKAHNASEFPTRRNFLSFLISAAVLAPRLLGETHTQTPADQAERFRQMSEEYEKEGLAAPFHGITTDGKVVPDLFPTSPTGVSTEPVRNAAERFIATLTSVQLTRTMFPIDDIQWRKWMNQHFYPRPGIGLQEMTEAQRDALIERVASKADKESIESMFDSARVRPVPEWVPDTLKPRVENWFQRKRPVEVWTGIQGRTHHYVAWIWYAVVIAFVMTSPYWWRRRQAPGPAESKSTTG